jgi:hypothetical protein
MYVSFWFRRILKEFWNVLFSIELVWVVGLKAIVIFFPMGYFLCNSIINLAYIFRVQLTTILSTYFFIESIVFFVLSIPMFSVIVGWSVAMAFNSDIYFSIHVFSKSCEPKMPRESIYAHKEIMTHLRYHFCGIF